MKLIQRNPWLLALSATLLILSTEVYSSLHAAKSVTLSSKQFVCTDTDSVGIEARCIQYTLVRGPKP